MPDSLRKCAEEHRDDYARSMLEKRGEFWNRCKGMDFWMYGDEYRNLIMPLFKMRLMGTPSFVFKVTGDYWDKREAMLAVGQIDGEWKVIDFAWEEKSRKAVSK